MLTANDTWAGVFADMARITRLHSKNAIDRAGTVVANFSAEKGEKSDDPEKYIDTFVESLEIVDNWRASHSFPLGYVTRTLRKRANRISNKAIVAARLKRLPSIRSKLIAEPNMALSKMQDLGGCRAIMPEVSDVETLTQEMFRCSQDAKIPPCNSPAIWKYNDYITNPKPSGYRGIHFVMEYHSATPDIEKAFGGQRIEIQLRSLLQHVWATAVETVATFENAPLKHNFPGNEEWRRFFALMSSAIAIREGRPTVPNTGDDLEVITELRVLATQRDVYNILSGYGTVIAVSGEAIAPDSTYVLLILDPVARTYNTIGYKRNEFEQAVEEYGDFEKEIIAKNGPEQVVLVSVQKIKKIREAYPNYRLDVGAFLRLLKEIVQ